MEAHRHVSQSVSQKLRCRGHLGHLGLGIVSELIDTQVRFNSRRNILQTVEIWVKLWSQEYVWNV